MKAYELLKSECETLTMVENKLRFMLAMVHEEIEEEQERLRLEAENFPVKRVSRASLHTTTYPAQRIADAFGSIVEDLHAC